MSQSPDPSSPRNPEELIPSKLTDGFAELYPTPCVPASLDSAILNAARAHLAGQAHRRRREGVTRWRHPLRWAGVAAVAAAAVAFTVIFPRLNKPGSSGSMSPPRLPALAADINGDGRVDILDAYVVARTLADRSRKTSLPAAWDLNHDGVVDQKDVDWIAKAAVQVGNRATAAGDSRPADSAAVFELAQDLKSLNANAPPSEAPITTALGPAAIDPHSDPAKGAAAP